MKHLNLKYNPLAECIRKACIPVAGLLLGLHSGITLANPEGGVITAGDGTSKLFHDVDQGHAPGGAYLLSVQDSNLFEDILPL